ncbi:MAG: S41 family peptidase [Candidatus Gastranaerophilales bacterium]|nr:S41 family peptidase [Candidatus Gastranaerophilales bacterium]
MKKNLPIYICLLSFVIFLSGCNTSFDVEVPRNKFLCEQKSEPACAKYLFLKSWVEIKEQSYGTNIDKQDWNYWRTRYLDKINNIQDAYVAIDTMVESLDDPYTRFLTKEEYEDQNENIDSSITGVGVVISSKDGKINVVDVIENSPALQNDLRKNDVIIKVDSTSVSGMDVRKVAEKIRGKENTKVELTLLRKDVSLVKNITRKKIDIKSVSHKMIGNVAYIKVSTFMSHNVAVEFVDALKNTANAKTVIIDLRGNQGGLLQNASFIASVFLPSGKIVSMKQKNGATEDLNVQKVFISDDRPVIVLINSSSASASEILAATLKEHQRAVLIGEKTYGKGLIQRITPLPSNTGINITIAKYLTPQGHDINKKGIEPDIKIDYTISDLKTGKDPQLDAAVKLAKKY